MKKLDQEQSRERSFIIIRLNGIVSNLKNILKSDTIRNIDKISLRKQIYFVKDTLRSIKSFKELPDE